MAEGSKTIGERIINADRLTGWHDGRFYQISVGNIAALTGNIDFVFEFLSNDFSEERRKLLEEVRRRVDRTYEEASRVAEDYGEIENPSPLEVARNTFYTKYEQMRESLE